MSKESFVEIGSIINLSLFSEVFLRSGYTIRIKIFPGLEFPVKSNELPRKVVLFFRKEASNE